MNSNDFENNQTTLNFEDYLFFDVEKRNINDKNIQINEKTIY